MSEHGTRASDWVVKPALCVDLDGTVRHNATEPGGFINEPEDVALFPDVEAKLWEWRDRGYLICGVSNQGGVAFGFTTPEKVDRALYVTLRSFERNPFHMVKQCYHHPDGKVEPYRHRSLLRKPQIGMLALMEWEAFNEGYVVDWSKSIMVGDRPEDASMAIKAEIGFIPADVFFGRSS